jgi:DNA-binding beta-propeller fold protein YncE
MTFLRLGRVVVCFVALLVWLGCGDTFRPVALPEPSTSPNPASLHFVLAVAENGAMDRGSVTRIDVAGDTNVGVQSVGVAPVHATLLANASRVYVANQIENTISSFALGISLTPTTTVLPAYSVPVFVTAANSTTVYAASVGISTVPPPPNPPCPVGCVSVIPVVNNVVTNIIPVGTNPVALAETPNALKLYAVNNGDGTVTSINTVDKTVNGAIATGSSPVWAIVRSDSQRLYVLNSGSGTLSVIDTGCNSIACGGATADTVLSTVSVGVGGNYMAYDSKRNRLYITNPVANTVTVLDVSFDPPSILFQVPVSASPVSVTALPDGSRFYVASLSTSGNSVTSLVTDFNNSNGSVRTTIPLGTVPIDTADPTGCQANSAGTPVARFRLSIASAGDSSRVYVAKCDAGNIAVISTGTNSSTGSPTDTLIQVGSSPGSAPDPNAGLPAPVSVFPPATVGGNPPRQNPVLLVAGP